MRADTGAPIWKELNSKCALVRGYQYGQRLFNRTKRDEVAAGKKIVTSCASSNNTSRDAAHAPVVAVHLRMVASHAWFLTIFLMTTSPDTIRVEFDALVVGEG